ncbi:MAG: hypothetical protein IKO35_01675, partial [Elusimicrobiaceae bacterium]|nr:hypothetical protein [Elusimicrobiaceae bacterium]
MKHYIVLFFLGVALPLLAQEEPEIIINLVGEPDTASTQTFSVWDKNALQLTKKLRGKTRTDVLYQADIVSSRDTFLRSADGTRYAFVQYTDNDQYRKFLFRAEEPQTFITCAANVQDVLAVNKRYQVNLGLTRKELLAAYPNLSAWQLPGVTLPAGQTLYRLTQANPQTGKKEPHFLLFDGRQLNRTFYSSQDAEKFFAAQLPPAQKQPPAVKQPTPAAPPKQPKTRKILIDGGTVEDQ